MKKHHLLVSLLLFVPYVFWGQITFSTVSFEEALNQSKQNGMMIFLQFESADCSKCNEVADKAFENKELNELLQQTFFCLKIEPTHPDRNTISALYNIKGFGSFFIDQNKTLIHSFPRSTTMAQEYKNQVDLALTKAGEGMRINELQKEYANNKNPGLLELLLQKRKSLNLETDSLLEEYVRILPADSTKSQTVIAFITQMAPIVGSKADQLMRRDYALFLRVWNTMSLPIRININNRIIFKSRMKAIHEKDEQYAYRVASFARGTYANTGNDPGTKSYEYNMMAFYKETNDTLNYLIRALYYYDNHFMLISPDSLKRRDSINRQQLLARAEMRTKENSTLNYKTTSYAPMGQFMAREINEGAWNLYKMTTDPLYLQKALQWAKKANTFWESAEALDTWACLLYKTGNKSEAISKQEEAIALQRKQGFSTKEYETILDKMKKGRVSLEN